MRRYKELVIFFGLNDKKMQIYILIALKQRSFSGEYVFTEEKKNIKFIDDFDGIFRKNIRNQEWFSPQVKTFPENHIVLVGKL